MNIERNAVAEFHYASAGNTSGEFIEPSIGTANITTRRIYRISDLKMSCATTATVKIIGRGADAGADKTMQFKLPANSAVSMSWEVPFRFNILSSAAQVRGIRASTDTTGVRFAISGYIEA